MIESIPQQTFKIAAGNRKHEAGLIREQRDFVPLNKTAQKTGTRRVEQDYRSISGFANKGPEADKGGMTSTDDTDDSEDLDEQETPEQTRRRRVLDFERHLEKNPQDIDKWIAFSSMQVEDFLPGRVKGALGLLDEASNVGNQTRAKGKRGAYEVALATLERAIKVSPTNAHSPKLQSAFFALAQQVWPSNQVTGKWQDVLRMFSSSTEKVDEKELMDLWLGYISWREGRGLGSRAADGKSSGGIDDVVEIYAQCIDMMRSSCFSSPESELAVSDNPHWTDSDTPRRCCRTDCGGRKYGVPPFAMRFAFATCRYATRCDGDIISMLTGGSQLRRFPRTRYRDMSSNAGTVSYVSNIEAGLRLIILLAQHILQTSRFACRSHTAPRYAMGRART